MLGKVGAAAWPDGADVSTSGSVLAQLLFHHLNHTILYTLFFIHGKVKMSVVRCLQGCDQHKDIIIVYKSHQGDSVASDKLQFHTFF